MPRLPRAEPVGLTATRPEQSRTLNLTMLRRRRARRELPVPDELDALVVSIECDEDVRGPDERAEARERAWRELRAIVAEAVIWQDAANDVLAAVSRREPLAELAPRGGPLARRFFELRRQLPAAADGELARQCETASVVLDHHGRVITYALELLAMDWRSDAIVAQLERLDGLGTPAERLDALYAELAHWR
jgi:hypothetical protein